MQKALLHSHLRPDVLADATASYVALIAPIVIVIGIVLGCLVVLVDYLTMSDVGTILILFIAINSLSVLYLSCTSPVRGRDTVIGTAVFGLVLATLIGFLIGATATVIVRGVITRLKRLLQRRR